MGGLTSCTHWVRTIFISNNKNNRKENIILTPETWQTQDNLRSTTNIINNGCGLSLHFNIRDKIEHSLIFLQMHMILSALRKISGQTQMIDILQIPTGSSD